MMCQMYIHTDDMHISLQYFYIDDDRIELNRKGLEYSAGKAVKRGR